ncbi:MAG: prevent-host-death family protein [Actinomycetaceae bacterium]|nr:prevent-host-death family protein [Actinomycetaceae bacterium]
MVSFFSRSSSSRSADEPAEQQEETPAVTSSGVNPEVVRAWKAELAQLTTDNRAEDSPRLTISSAHPGGLAQLYADHATRLSNLVREPLSHARAVDRAEAVIARSQELTMRHGLGTVHLAIGRAHWVRGSERISSPVFLRPIHVEMGENDILLTLRPGTVVAPLLANALEEAGVDVDLLGVMRGASTAHGFSASKALASMRDLASVLDRFELREELVLGIFEHPAASLQREMDDSAWLLASPVVRALAGDDEAARLLETELPEPNPHDRDPWKEMGAGDLTPRQADLVETISTGKSLFVDVPHGADSAAVLAAVLAQGAAKGRSIIHVASSSSRTTRVEARLKALGLADIAARIDASPAAATALGDRLARAMTDLTVLPDNGRIDRMRKRLVEVRELLAGHTSHLHQPFRGFGVSAFDALQVLTDLTSTSPAPRTRVRFREEILLDIASDQGERAREVLHRAVNLGMFSPSTAHAAWKGVHLANDSQVEQVLDCVGRLADETLPQMRDDIAAAVESTGVREVTSLSEWEEQLAMFEGIREVLDVFVPRVFERSAADMVIATASRQWRKERGINMPRSQRVRLVRQAQDLVRPGSHVKDLHGALVGVQERREAWRAHCEADGWPSLPSDLDGMIATAGDVRQDIARLQPYLADVEPDMEHTPVAHLARLAERLSADSDGARHLPRRSGVHEELTDLGLAAFADDMRDRMVLPELIDAELDLAWWASILGLMIASDPHLGGTEPASLEGLLAEGRDLDQAQVESLTPQVLDHLRRRRKKELEKDRTAQAALQGDLGLVIPAPDLWARHPLVARLVPVALTVPTLVPWILPRGRYADVAILDGIDDLPLAELIPIIARTRQVIVLADSATAREGGPVEALARILPQVSMEVTPTRLNDQVALLLARQGVEHTGVPVPWTAPQAPVTAVWTDGTGMPAPGSACVETSPQEVAAVVEEVLAHALEQPERSLGVIALNARHAERVRQAITKELGHEDGVAAFFSDDQVEPFVVVDPDGARGLTRDRIILTVGFAKTPHGRVLHDFGAFSQPNGVAVMAGVLRAVRGDLTVISSLRPEEFDRSRVRAKGARMLIDLLDIAQGQSGQGSDAWPVLEAAPDRLLVDLAERLYGIGLEVVPNVGIPGGMRIPLAIGHPEVPGRLLVAVLTDDDEYVSEPSLRVRDRLRPAMLEEQGWRVHTALSMAVFIDPGKEAETIVHTVLDAVDEAIGPREDVLDVPIVDDDPDAFGDFAAEDALPARNQVQWFPDPHSEDSRERRDAVAETILTGSLAAVAPIPDRGPRPAIARGLPLAAYGDDQLDELADWVRSDGIERTHAEMVEELREALGLHRRGAQSDAVLGNVVRRTDPGHRHE